MINLHAHSEYSSLDGFSQIDKIVERVKQLGQSAIALTDHGNLNGAYKFYNACKKAGIKPILGNEMYICPEYTDVKPNHITLLAYNNEGWRNLLKLHKISYLHKYYKPRINIKDLEIHSAGLIVLSGCPSGLMSKNIRDNKLQEAIEWMQTLKRIFKDNFYIEIMEHGIPFQKDLNKTLRELSRKYNIPKVFTIDCHYLKREDATFQDYLLCDQLKTNIYDTTRTLKHEVSEFYIKTAEETSAEPDEITNTIKIADQCNVEIKSQKWLLPQIENSTEIFAQLINEGIEKRGIPRNDVYMSRLREEYKTIIEASLVGYLLTVYDYIHYAKENGILVGPGRGSVGGCLAAYLIGIHDVDPIKHNLLFSRFYNAGRSASLPDIDIDFPEKHIDTIRQYVKNKYGQEKVAHIGTNTYLQPKGAVKLICRVLGIDFKQSNLYSATIEDTAATEALAQSDSVFADIMTKAKNFENLAVYNSIHAAGIVISPIDLETIVPLRVNEDNGLYVTGWDMEDIEGIGLVKFDFLSLGTLDVISDALKLSNIKLEDIPTDDQKTFDLISTTRNVGIFQLSSEGISKVANEMKVQSIDDIAVVVALYRPGPMASDLHNIYISRKIGTSPIYYDHPLLESVLKETYGLIVFQEQVTQIAMVLAKITEKEADNLRKAIGKKIPELMKEQKELFINGCKTNNIDISVADKLWKEMEVFASYAFNRAHATEYAYITYYTSYLKAHYPVQFMAAILNNSYNKPDKLSTYLLECQKMGIKVIPPSLVRGNYDFRVDQDEIVYGLKGVKGISEKTAQEIYQQKYESFSDFVYKYKPSKDLIIFLAESGALDEFGYKRNQIIQSAGSIIEQIKRDRKDSKTKSLFGKLKEIYIPVVEESAEVDLATKEYERLGTYLVYNPLRGVTLNTPDLLEGEIFIEGFVSKIETRITKKKNTIAIISLVTNLGPIEALLMPQLFLEQKDNIKQNSYVSISGNYEDKLIVHKIWKKEVVNDSNNSRMDYF